MESVTSEDGTRIAYKRVGDGLPLVLVHGTATNHLVWEPVLPELGKHFSVYAMDRRGRGESGNGDAYDIDREIADVEAVCDAIDGPVNLLGHSFGAVCALGTIPRISDLRRVILYEPPLWTEAREPLPETVIERMETLAERGENEAILETFFEEVTGNPDRLRLFRSQPRYQARVEAASKMPREIRARRTFRPDATTFADVDVPTRFFLGTESSQGLKLSIRAARDILPNAEIIHLEGQGHAAMSTAPDLFCSEVVDFLGDY